MKLLTELTGYGIDYYMDRMIHLSTLTKIPLVGHILRAVGDYLAPGMHSGQIITTQEAIKMLQLADNVCILDCMCRRLIHGEKKMICINFGPIKELFEMVKPSEKIEVRPVEEVQELIQDFGSQGFFHQVLWAKIPFPVAICSCQINYCCSAKLRFLYKIKSSLLKGHYVSSVSEMCDGCIDEEEPICVRNCSFKAMRHEPAVNRAKVDPKLCFGCGVCKQVCPKSAIFLVDRATIPAIQHSW